MRLNELLQLTEQQDGVAEAAQQIAKHCSPYLQTVNIDDVQLWRGIKNDQTYFYRQIRQDRQPLDTHPVIHQIADNFFKQTFNVALRSESVFVVRGQRAAKLFGKPYVVFPTESSWRVFGSEQVEDFTSHIAAVLHLELKELFDDKLAKANWRNSNPPPLSTSEYQQLQRVVYRALEEADYQQLQLEDLRDFPPMNELMLTGVGYYAVAADNVDNLYHAIHDME